MKLHKKIILLEILSTIVTVLPLLILFMINYQDYTKKVSPFGLSLTGIVYVIFVYLTVKNKLKLENQKTLKFLIFFIFCYVFEPFLADLKIISFMAFVGVLVNNIFFENKIKRLKRMLERECDDNG